MGQSYGWVDKAQTEAFTFSLLAIALVLLRERPWWSFVCLGAASTQNLPIAAALVLAVVAAVALNRAWLRTRAFWVGLGVAVGLALLAPIYYLVRIGEVSSQIGTAERSQIPSWAEFKVPLLDLNSGLVFNAPILVITIGAIFLAMLLNQRGRLLDPPLIAAMLMALVFLISFSQTPNFNAGGTPRLTRYALWLLPLAIPLLLLAQDTFGARLRRWLIPAAVASCALSLLMFAPSKPDSYLTPTRLASWVWSHHPGFDNPLPEIFFERNGQRDSPPLEPVANPSCSKILLVDGNSPAGCRIGPIPKECARGPCYANRSDGTYNFIRAPIVKPERRSRRPERTVRSWLTKGRRGEGEDYAEFAAEVDQTRTLQTMVAGLVAATSSWRGCGRQSWRVGPGDAIYWRC